MKLRAVERYFDHNATAAPMTGLRELADQMLCEGPLNPSSVHGYGRRGKAILERARRNVCGAVGASTEELHFTSGATEAIANFIEGFLTQGDAVLVNPLEHPAVFGALKRVGANISLMEVDACGRIDVEKVALQVTEETRLIILMLAQNELGNIYPVQAMAARVAPIPVFCDLVQGVGKLSVDLPALGIAGAAISGHKIGALSGVGALWTRRDIVLSPRTIGGAQERGERGGTENLLGISSFGLAAEHLDERLLAQARLRTYRQHLERSLLQVDGLAVLGDPNNMLSNTLFFRTAGIPGDLVVQAMDLEGFCLSTGSACSSGSVEPSQTLLAMGYSAQDAVEGVRISMGPETTEEAVVMLAKVLRDKLKEFLPKKGSSF